MSLTLVISPMFSGKTSFLLSKIVGLSKLGFKTVYVNHSIDNRNKDSDISCHNKLIENGLTNCSFDILKSSDLREISSMDKDYYFIDEFQFFNQNAVPIVLNLVSRGKHVFIAALKGDYKNEEFGYTLKLVPHADNIHVLKSLCVECAKEGKCIDAPFTKYTKITKESDRNQVEVGSDELYIPVCRNHHEY